MPLGIDWQVMFLAILLTTAFLLLSIWYLFLAKPSEVDQSEEEESVETTTMLVTIAPTEEDMTTLPPDSGDLFKIKILRVIYYYKHCYWHIKCPLQVKQSKSSNILINLNMKGDIYQFTTFFVSFATGTTLLSWFTCYSNKYTDYFV